MLRRWVQSVPELIENSLQMLARSDPLREQADANLGAAQVCWIRGGQQLPEQE